MQGSPMLHECNDLRNASLFAAIVFILRTLLLIVRIHALFFLSWSISSVLDENKSWLDIFPGNSHLLSGYFMQVLELVGDRIIDRYCVIVRWRISSK